MTQQPSPARPPRLAAWLVDLLASREQAECILGDLREEFSYLASSRGIANARRWYRLQSAKTIAHLAAAALLVRPLWLAGQSRRRDRLPPLTVRTGKKLTLFIARNLGITRE